MKYSCLLSKLDSSDIVEIPFKLRRPSTYRTPNQMPVQDLRSEPLDIPCVIMEQLHFQGRLRNIKPKVSIQDIYNSRSDKEHEFMSVREAYEFLISKKTITKFARLSEIDQCILSMFSNGPLLFVLPVNSENETQFWKGSNFSGYHAVACIGYDNGTFTIKNSWGTDYGHRGYAQFSFKDFNLIKEIWTIIVK